ncbi:MAG: penicillin-binding transpeptidase domain-containing protein, partial [Deltaproteobacteria bacterium]
RALSGPHNVRPNVSLAYHLAHQLLSRGGERVASTLDGRLQKFALEALQYQLSFLEKQNVNDGAVLVADNRSGEILAYVGSLPGSHVDGVKAKRQAGSTLKPFLYELAIEKRLLTASSILDDQPLNLQTSGGLYVPHNYDNEYKGAVTVRVALSSSLNIPAVKALMLTGPELFAGRLRDLGFDLNESGDYYGYSLALGSADVSLYELVNGYRALANGGRWSELKLALDKKEKTRKVLNREASFIISDILSDRQARSVTFGLENSLSTRFWTAVKTGTSKDMRDNWCVGYSEKYTVGVWVGNFTGEPMWSVSGITGAAPVWLEIMNYLHSSNTSVSPRPPAGVLARRMESARDEWYMKGTEPADHFEADRPNDEPPKITYPSDGAVIALDPDIPEEQQKVFFEAQGSAPGFEWLLNDERMGDSNVAVSWRPRGGKYKLSIVDRQNMVIDSVRFEVR